VSAESEMNDVNRQHLSPVSNSSFVSIVVTDPRIFPHLLPEKPKKKRPAAALSSLIRFFCTVSSCRTEDAKVQHSALHTRQQKLEVYYPMEVGRVKKKADFLTFLNTGIREMRYFTYITNQPIIVSTNPPTPPQSDRNPGRCPKTHPYTYCPARHPQCSIPGPQSRLPDSMPS